MFAQNSTIVGLNSLDTAIPAAGPVFVSGKVQLPRLAAGSTGVSAVVVTITNQTGPVTLYTGTAGADGFYVDTNVAAGDVIRVALTSANSIDSATYNSVKCELSIGSGQ